MQANQRESSLAPPPGSDSSELADWAEATLRIEGRTKLSRSALRQRLLAVRTGDDSELDLILGEINRRSLLAPGRYPFRRSGSGFRLESTIDPTIYDYLLLCSLREVPFRKEGAFAKVEQGLDQLTLAALLTHMGPGSQAVRFAWPASGGRPTQFSLAVDWLAKQLGLEAGSGRKSPHKKDGGVDLVVWRGFRDGRSAFRILLVQTTLQRKWREKAKDIGVNQWGGWIMFGSPPSTALVIPAAVSPGHDHWEDARHDAQLLVDRTRLCELLEGVDDGALVGLDGSPLLPRMAKWTQEQYEALVA